MILLRGVNVGGHKTFRPTELVKALSHLDIVNIGAAGTFVVRDKIAQPALRAEVAQALPFATEIIICKGSDVLKLTSSDPFAAERNSADIAQFVSTLAKIKKPTSDLPINLPTTGKWGMRILSQTGQFVCGVYRREMKAVSYLGQIDKIFGVPATTRNWNTMQTIARVLGS